MDRVSPISREHSVTDIILSNKEENGAFSFCNPGSTSRPQELPSTPRTSTHDVPPLSPTKWKILSQPFVPSSFPHTMLSWIPNPCFLHTAHISFLQLGQNHSPLGTLYASYLFLPLTFR